VDETGSPHSPPPAFTVNGRIVLIADRIKAPKTGRKMPAVKKLHQESQNNSKPEYIFGHSCQAIAVVVKAAQSFFALPLACRIYEGVIFTNRDKLILLFKELALARPALLVGNAYYATAKIILPLLRDGHHLVSALKSNAVAYAPVPVPVRRKRGRPSRYGRKVRLKTLFADESAFTEVPSPFMGKKASSYAIAA
jgi:hypothetical protein